MNSKHHSLILTALVSAVCLSFSGCAGLDIGSIGVGGIATVPTYAQDQLIRTGPFELRLDKVYWADRIDNGYGRTKTPQAKFLIVHLHATNLTNQALQWAPPPIFTLVSPSGAEYNSGGQQVSMDDLTGEIILGTNVNPGMAIEGVAIFDVPQAPGYVLNLSNGRWVGGWNYAKGPLVLRVTLTPTSN